MTNRVLHTLRDQTVTTIASTDGRAQAIVAMLNQAKDDILDGYPWPFNVRHDGLVELPAKLSGTTGTVTNGSATVSLPLTLAQLTDMLGGKQIRVAITDDSVFPNTAFRAESIEWSGSAWTVTLQTAWEGDTDSGSAAFDVFSHELLLPDTVKRVLSVTHQEQNVPLRWVDRALSYEASVPRPQDIFSDNPDVVSVGGHIANTTSSHSSVTDGSAATRLGMMVSPPPDTKLFLNYSYVVRYADLSSNSDTFTGVPASVTSIIERQAYLLALRSNIQSNPTMAAEVEGEIARRIRRVLDSMKRDPNRRDVGRPFDPLRAPRPYRSRWSSQTVPTPS